MLERNFVTHSDRYPNEGGKGAKSKQSAGTKETVKEEKEQTEGGQEQQAKSGQNQGRIGVTKGARERVRSYQRG
jgi:hypothetical protein